jgi:hypothetical protein
MRSSIIGRLSPALSPSIGRLHSCGAIGACILFLVLGAVSGCARLGNEGEGCSNPALSESQYAHEGFGGGCATGLICAPDHLATGAYTTWETASCRTLCASSAECPTGTTCRGVTGAEYRMACLPVAPD